MTTNKGIELNAALSYKLDFLFLSLYKEQESLGKVINFYRWLMNASESFYGAFNKIELAFYMECLIDRRLLECEQKASINGFDRAIPLKVRINENGVNYFVKINEEGLNSRKCFIAMSFSPEHEYIFNKGISLALKETNFEELKVNEDKTLKYRDNESTINDFILVSIRQSKFCIADYTGNRNGVYFETGYALAKGKHVIYTCLKSEFENVHFDTDRFPFILYDSTEELKEKLINRIKEVIIV
jgi:hypothetical protein